MPKDKATLKNKSIVLVRKFFTPILKATTISAKNKNRVMKTTFERAKSKFVEETKSELKFGQKARGNWQVIFANAVLLRTGRRQHDFNPNAREVAPPQTKSLCISTRVIGE